VKININNIILDERKILSRYAIFRYNYNINTEDVRLENVPSIVPDVGISVENNNHNINITPVDIDTSGC